MCFELKKIQTYIYNDQISKYFIVKNIYFFAELPEKPKIFDEKDKEVIGTAGPYVEDSSLKLTCVVSGGKLDYR